MNLNIVLQEISLYKLKGKEYELASRFEDDYLWSYKYTDFNLYLKSIFNIRNRNITKTLWNTTEDIKYKFLLKIRIKIDSYLKTKILN